MKDQDIKIMQEPMIFIPIIIVILFAMWAIFSTVKHNIKEETRQELNEKVMILLEECRDAKPNSAPVQSPPVEKKQPTVAEQFEKEIHTPSKKEAEKINKIVEELTK